MKTRFFITYLVQYLQSLITILKKGQIVSLSFMFLTIFSACSSSGIYSIIVSNPGIQSEQNDLNDLGEPYKKKKLVFPDAVVSMSENERIRWLDTLNQYHVHTIDTSVKIGAFKTPGLVMLSIPACGKKGVAIIMIDNVGTKKGGKLIEIELRYVCKDDNPDVDWGYPGKFWAASPLYKIDIQDSNNGCYDGYQSIEFQFSPEKENPVLRSVLIICADE